MNDPDLENHGKNEGEMGDIWQRKDATATIKEVQDKEPIVHRNT